MFPGCFPPPPFV